MATLPSRPFTSDEISTGLHRVSAKTTASAFVDHPHESIAEFLESGAITGESVAHRFPHSLGSVHPKASLQYSLGTPKGRNKNRICGPLLLDLKTQLPALCEHEYLTCGGVKLCDAQDLCDSSTSLPAAQLPRTAKDDVFLKTFSYFCALRSTGCSFSPIEGEDVDSSSSSGSSTCASSSRKKEPSTKQCQGRLVMLYDEFRRPYIQCCMRSKQDTQHIILRNLDEFDITYLAALLQDDFDVINRYELEAQSRGYGPRVPCSFSAPPSAQKEFCPSWHRYRDGTLRRGVLDREAGSCPTVFSIFTPYDLSSCPHVLILSRNPHSHGEPLRTKTPPSVRATFCDLLLKMDWRLADVTPRKLLIDSGFIRDLREHLKWPTHSPDPSLSDLHPSFINMDHVRRLINDLRSEHYPEGTGFAGAELLLERGQACIDSQPYLRCVERHDLPDGKTLLLVLCISPEMSHHLMAALFITIDTSYKRVGNKWLEFEVETWNKNGMRSIVVARAFTTCQSADAHLILLKRIFHFAELDTGKTVKFRYMDGEGFEGIIADAHRGQALGVGKFLRETAKPLGSTTKCRYSGVLLSSLDDYGHLKRIYQVCFTHFRRNIDEIATHITPRIRSAMLSLSCPEEDPLYDIDSVIREIQQSGPKAAAWMKDKINSKFVMPALYQPWSCIPVDVWKAAPQTTNGNEQQHANINRDGTDLTLLGGIMRGLRYDHENMKLLANHAAHGIGPRDRPATLEHRLERSIQRHVIAQQRTAYRNLQVAAPGLISRSQLSSVASDIGEVYTGDYDISYDNEVFVTEDAHTNECADFEHPEHAAITYDKFSHYSTLSGALGGYRYNVTE